MRARYKACILSLFVPLAAFGQSYRAVVTESIWTGSQNAAGWRAPNYLDGMRPHVNVEDSDKSSDKLYGEASLFGSYEDGGFKPPHGGRDVWTAGVSASSLLDLSRTTLFGSIRFEQRNAQEMMGSLFIQPGKYPFDILEFTPGPKTRQTYSVSGGFAREVDTDWLFGVQAGIDASNYAKRKDIRHTNYALDLSVSPGVLYHWQLEQDLNLDLGLSYQFRKTSESVDAEQVGAATSDSYFAFFDKGMSYGTYQVWDGAGIHLDEAGVGLLPVTEITHGGAVQACLESVIYLEIGFDHTEGLLGEKGYDWFRFPGNQAHLDFELRCPPEALFDNKMLVFRSHLQSRTQTLREAVWDKETSGGVTTPIVYDYNRVYRRKNGEERFSLSLVGERGRSLLQLEYGHRPGKEYSTLMYPYVDTLATNVSHLELSGRFFIYPHSFYAGRALCSLSFRLRGQWGSCHEQGLVATDAAAVPESEPFRLTNDWVRKREYMTAPRIMAGLAIRKDLRRGVFLEASGSFTRAFKLEYLGSNRWSTMLKIGADF